DGASTDGTTPGVTASSGTPNDRTSDTAAGPAKPATESASQPTVQSTSQLAEQPRQIGVPDLRLIAPQWSDASDHRSASITFTVKNVGDRPALVHLRPDDLELRVQRPDGSVVVCAPGSGYRASVRDFFVTIAPGKSSSMTTLLAERCPSRTWDRPGVYYLFPVLRVRDSGASVGLQAVTGDFAPPHPTALRIQSTRLPYHSAPPFVALPGACPDKQ
ncbi:MAG: hypothetical protein FWD57_08945, partial [Polyangiaceae bacterium]|nr:hypothetical protein [Polyangiaceae bacterium]